MEKNTQFFESALNEQYAEIFMERRHSGGGIYDIPFEYGGLYAGPHGAD